MSENKRVYICDVDYLYQEGAPEFKNFEGGAVYVFILAYDVRAALEILIKDFAERKLDPKEIVSVMPYDVNQEWDTEEIQAHYLALYEECAIGNEIVYDDFLAYEKEQ